MMIRFMPRIINLITRAGIRLITGLGIVRATGLMGHAIILVLLADRAGAPDGVWGLCIFRAEDGGGKIVTVHSLIGCLHSRSTKKCSGFAVV